MEIGRGTVLDLIAHAVTAGSLSRAAREYPEARRGLEKARRFHHSRVSSLAGEIIGAADCTHAPAAPLAIRETRRR